MVTILRVYTLYLTTSDTPNNSTNNKISLEDYPIDLVNLDEILEESHHIWNVLQIKSI